MHERTLARTSHARYHGKYTEGNIHTHILQVMGGGIRNMEMVGGAADAVLKLHAVGEVAARQGVGLLEFLYTALETDLAAATSGIFTSGSCVSAGSCGAASAATSRTGATSTTSGTGATSTTGGTST